MNSGWIILNCFCSKFYDSCEILKCLKRNISSLLSCLQVTCKNIHFAIIRSVLAFWFLPLCLLLLSCFYQPVLARSCDTATGLTAKGKWPEATSQHSTHIDFPFSGLMTRVIQCRPLHFVPSGIWIIRSLCGSLNMVNNMRLNTIVCASYILNWKLK